MNGYKQICHCGHDIDTHYVNRAASPPERAACLASGCACGRYVNEHDPAPKRVKARPNHKSWCRCFDCKAYDSQSKLSAASALPAKDADTEPPGAPDSAPWWLP